MKRLVVFFSIFCALWAQQSKEVKLALSGGGARGLAHIGVIQALEEYGFKITGIAGTSAGALVGSLYAAGYSVEEIRSIMYEFTSQKEIFSDFSRKDIPIERKFNSYTSFFDVGVENYNFVLPSSLSGDTRLNYILMKYLTAPSIKAGNDFRKLEIPLCVVASDLFREEAIYFREGDLAKVVRASISIPTALIPMQIEDYYLVDGGIYNNLPSNVFAEDDFVIAVNTASASYKNSSEIKSIVDLMGHMVNVLSAKSDSLSIKKEDLFIEPELGAYTATDWFSVDSLIKRGYQKTVEILEKQQYRKRKTLELKKEQVIDFENYTVGHLSLVGNYRLTKSHIMKNLALEEGEPFRWENIRKGVNRLFAQNLITGYWVNFKITNEKLDIQLDIKENILTRFGVGGFYQTKMGNNINLNLKFIGRLGFAETIEVNGLIGDYMNGFRLGLRYNSLLQIPLFDYFNFEVKNIDPLRLDSTSAEFTWFKAEYSSGLQIDRNMMLLASIAYKRLQSRVGKNSQASQNPRDRYENISFTAQYVFENLDDLYFPTEGSALSIRYKFNNIKYLELNGLSGVSANLGASSINFNHFNVDFQTHFSIFNNFSIFSQHYKFGTILNEGTKTVPLIEQNRYDLTRSAFGYFDPNLYNYHSFIASFAIKQKIVSNLFFYSSYTLARRWDILEKIQFKSFDLSTMDKGFEIGFYLPTFLGPMSFTYSFDDYFNGVTRFSIGYLIE